MARSVDIRFVCDGCDTAVVEENVETLGGHVSVNDVAVPKGWREIADLIACSDKCYEVAFDKARGRARKDALERVDGIFNRMRERK